MPKLPTDFLYGACYYPEHWPADRHEADLVRMERAGLNVVRMGEGAWAYWEPEEGRYQFDLFDRVIDLCRTHGIRVVMGTPTYAGPAWVAHAYPEVLRWNFNRVPMAHGSRRNFNYTSPKYLELSDRLVTALAAHYAGNDQIIAWQLDNEFNCHMDVSYAPSDTRAWRAWLREKYRTLDRLNAAWGTAFWSQTYSDWEQIDLPHPTATYLNPSVLLDESRFISDCVVRFARRQADILRRHDRRWVITHNDVFGNVDAVKLTGVLDVSARDQYPPFFGDWPNVANPLVRHRSLSFPFWVLEQNAGPGGQMQYLHPTPRPGQIRLWAFQTVAHGATAVLYFLWRTCPFGSEQHWHGILDQDDRDNRRLAEVARLGAEVRKLAPAFFAARPDRCVAVFRDFDNEVHDKRVNTYTATGDGEDWGWARAAMELHLPADHVWAASDWRGYDLVVLTHPRIATKALADKVAQYVTAGGTVVIGALAGVYDENGHVVRQPRPGVFRKLAGLEVEDWTTLGKDDTRAARLVGGQTVACRTFVERLALRTAEPLAYWAGGDPLLGTAPAIAVNRVGKGRVVYVGGYLPQPAVEALLGLLAADLGLTPVVRASAQVEAISRGGGRYVAVLNHAAGDELVTGLTGAKLLTGDGTVSKTGELRLPPYGIAVVERM